MAQSLIVIFLIKIEIANTNSIYCLFVELHNLAKMLTLCINRVKINSNSSNNYNNSK